MNDAEVLQALAAATARLADALDRETDCLRGGHLGELGALQSEKRTLMADYEAGVAALRRRSDGTALDPGLRDALTKAGERLQAAAERNRRAIAVAQTVAGRVLETVTRAAAEEAGRNRGYGAAVAPGCRRVAPEALSIALDRRL